MFVIVDNLYSYKTLRRESHEVLVYGTKMNCNISLKLSAVSYFPTTVVIQIKAHCTTSFYNFQSVQ